MVTPIIAPNLCLDYLFRQQCKVNKLKQSSKVTQLRSQRLEGATQRKNSRSLQRDPLEPVAEH